jgi:hypothetical protein
VERTSEGRTEHVPSETGLAKFAEFLHGKGSCVSDIIELLAYSMLSMTLLSIGKSTQKKQNITHLGFWGGFWVRSSL